MMCRSDNTYTDKWKSMRAGLWANTEPEVKLIGLTVPGEMDSDGMSFAITSGSFVESWQVERQVARAATVSTGVDIKNQGGLVRKLIDLGHHTPLEVIQYVFHVTGISKAAAAQMSRHRIGQGHVSSSRRYQTQGIRFVYPLLENIDDEATARQTYTIIQDSYQEAYSCYTGLRCIGVKKGDCRYLIPTASSQERIWWVNARALRDFLKLRLHLTAEAEVRRLANMILGVAMQITPTLFEDVSK